jgi:hypothetical protein
VLGIPHQFVQEFNTLSFCRLNIGIDGTTAAYYSIYLSLIHAKTYEDSCVIAKQALLMYSIKLITMAFPAKNHP